MNESPRSLVTIDIYLATFLGTNSLSVLMCRKTVNQSINQSDETITVSSCYLTPLVVL